MWLKGLIAALVICFCTLLGYLAADRYRSRAKFFSQFEEFNLRYLGELAYSRKPLERFLSSANATGDFERVIEDVKSRAPVRKIPCLTKEEQLRVEDYLSMLGRGDSFSQSEYFSARKAELADSKQKAEAEAKARGSLYLKLGLLAGLAFVILIV